jgi:hypothetical protein
LEAINLSWVAEYTKSGVRLYWLLSTSVQKKAPWAFTAHQFLVVKWGLAIEIAGEKLSWTRETTRVWAADHDDWSAKVAGEGCKRPLEA